MIGEVMAKRKMSQKRLAEESGVSLASVVKYDEGINLVDRAALVTALKLANALKCSLRMLVTGRETADAIAEYEAMVVRNVKV